MKAIPTSVKAQFSTMKTELKRELTLQDLAPYLPYRLDPLKVKYGNRIYTLEGLSGGRHVALRQAMMVTDNVHVMAIKPFLIPLNEVTNDLFDEIGFADEEDFIACVLDGSILHSNWIKLVKGHYDVFGLLDAGLALNKSEYSNI